MSKINIKYISDEALETIRVNIERFTDIAKNNPNNNEEFLNNLPKNYFVEKKYVIEDFALKTDSSEYKNVDFQNSVTLYEHLNCLPKYVLGDERFWLWVILEKGYAAAIQAMPIESGKNIIKDHWMFGQGKRRGLMFGVFSRSYYKVFLTKDDSLSNKYELTHFATENILRYREFTWRTYSNNGKIVRGALKAEKNTIDKYGDSIEGIDEYYQKIAKHISKLGSVKLLDIQTEDYIKKYVENFCDELAKDNGIPKI